MQTNPKCYLWQALLCAGLTTGAWAQGVGLSAKVGTLGLGADLTVGLIDQLGVRVGINGFQYQYDYTDADPDADVSEITADLDFRTIPILLDWHPFRGGFRLSGGVVKNDNRIEVSAVPGQTIEVNNQEYAILRLNGSAAWDEWSWYAGLGYGNAAGKDGRWHFAFDLGVMFQGAPEVELNAEASDATLQTALDADLAEEEINLQSDAEDFDIYPVLSLGFSFRF